MCQTHWDEPVRPQTVRVILKTELLFGDAQALESFSGYTDFRHSAQTVPVHYQKGLIESNWAANNRFSLASANVA